MEMEQKAEEGGKEQEATGGRTRDTGDAQAANGSEG